MPRFCTSCGTQIAEGIKFCNKCGTPIGGPQAQPPARPTIVSPPDTPPRQFAPSEPPTQVYQAVPPPTQPQYTAPTTPQYQSPAPSPAGYGPSPYQQPVMEPSAELPAGSLQKNIAGLLCYLFVPAIIFLVLEPYNKSRFIRFHAFQSLFLTAAWIVLRVMLSVLWMILPGVLSFVLGLALMVVGLGFFVLWIFLMYRAYNNEMFKLPIIGELAEQQAK